MTRANSTMGLEDDGCARNHRAALVGGVVVVYAFGFVIQSALTGAPIAAVALASMGFVAGDTIKAVVASLAAAGLSKLGR